MHIFLMIFLNLFFLVLGLVALKWISFITFLCGALLITLGGYMAVNNQVIMDYHYVNATATWASNIETLPYSPYPQFFMIICGIILMIAFAVELNE